MSTNMHTEHKVLYGPIFPNYLGYDNVRGLGLGKGWRGYRVVLFLLTDII